MPHSLLDSPWHLAKMGEKDNLVAGQEQPLNKREPSCRAIQTDA
jgi:hypothetical protein